MFGRCGAVSPLALACTLLVGLTVVGRAQAHRLDAQALVRPNRQVQIESWFSSGEAARRAKVEVVQADGTVLAQGKMDDQGVFVFSYHQPEALTVVISAGEGHRKELNLAAADLATAESAVASPASETASAPRAVPLAVRESGITVKDILIGLSFLLSSAAFWLSLRNARTLRERMKTEC
jgi:nickel transport protein